MSQAAPLGWHWIAEAEEVPVSHLESEAHVAAFLRTLPAELGLTAVGEPTVTVGAGGSVIGVILLSESHASVHTAPSSGRLWVDLFSCVRFDVERAEELLLTSWAPGAHHCTLLERGRLHPERARPEPKG